ncbi:hypothetical protein AGMMS50230_00270 [Spirochaetia bacterium]|nr:hypothetical protein AGMMS50230_00270 [Spirochaetia bacterium]
METDTVKAPSAAVPSSRFTLGDGLTILVCLAGVLFCLWLFWSALNNTLTRMNETPVGTISWKYKAAQRRFIDRVLWDRIRRDSPVYTGDLIRTADHSEATITLRDGGATISLAENSLIEISLENNIPRIKGASGDIGVSAGTSQMTLVLGDKELTLTSGSAVSVRSNGERGTNLWVSEGTVSITGPEGITEAGAGSALSLDAGGTGPVPRTAVLFPPPDAHYYTSGASAEVNFGFNPLDYDGHLTRLDISPSRRFSRNLVNRTMEDNRGSIELTPGTWWWRAYPAAAGSTGPDPDAFPPASGQITVHFTPVPVLIFPDAGAVLGPAQVRFRWILPSGGDGAEKYLLEAADNPDFTNTRLSIESSGNSIAVTLENGRWYWRVTPLYAAYTGTPSAAASFTVEDRAAVPLLTAPGNNAALVKDKPVYLSWRGEGPGPWNLVISAGADMTKPLVNENAARAYYVRELEPGRYYWQVSGAGGASAVWSFTVGDRARPPPFVTQPVPVTQAVPSPVPVPQPSPPAPVSVPPAPPRPAPSRSAVPPVPPPVSVPPQPVPPPPVPVPQPAPVSVPPPVTPSPAPLIGGLSPDGTVYTAVWFKTNTAIPFVWNAVPGAGSYRFILRDKDGIEVFSKTVQNPGFMLDDFQGLSRGNFTWRVEALNQKGEETAGEGSFTVDLPEIHNPALPDPGTLYGK